MIECCWSRHAAYIISRFESVDRGLSVGNREVLLDGVVGTERSSRTSECCVVGNGHATQSSESRPMQGNTTR